MSTRAAPARSSSAGQGPPTPRAAPSSRQWVSTLMDRLPSATPCAPPGDDGGSPDVDRVREDPGAKLPIQFEPGFQAVDPGLLHGERELGLAVRLRDFLAVTQQAHG